MGTVIDSSVFIATERGKYDLAGAVRRDPANEFVIASITASELLRGVHQADSERRATREEFVEAIITTFRVVAFDLPVARLHAKLASQLAARGHPVGAHDLLIAATALHLGFEVLTGDQRSFPHIPGVVLKAL